MSRVTIEKMQFKILQRNIIHTLNTLETDLYSLDELKGILYKQHESRVEARNEIEDVKEFIKEICYRVDNLKEIIS